MYEALVLVLLNWNKAGKEYFKSALKFLLADKK